MKKVGFIGWRGLVGSVLLERMKEERDFEDIQSFYFSTSTPGQNYVCPQEKTHILKDAYNTEELTQMDILVSCQGGDYTKEVYDKLRASGWTGYWIDAASAKRMDADSLIVLDPINRSEINKALRSGCKNFIGGNCSITLSLLGLIGLLKTGKVEWLSLMTYQAASGAGAAQVKELLAQMSYISNYIGKEPASTLATLHKAQEALQSDNFPVKDLTVPLAGSVIPWIDTDLGNGHSREEWKGEVETNKILALPPQTLKVDGLCIRVPTLRSHAAAITFKLKEDIPLEKIERLIQSAHEWVDYIPNNKKDSIHCLSPAAVSGTLKIAVGRLKKLNLGENMYSVFTVGDQLLWGAAEPLRRMLRILVGEK